MKRSIFNYLKGFDYLIKTGNTVDDCYPHYTVDTKGEAVDTAKDLLKIYGYTEVVYIPKNTTIWCSNGENL